jgi:subtilisin family serine protease/membrane protease YdiL (CAAX protease family)
MNDGPTPSQPPSAAHWLLLLAMAAWLAVVPLAVVGLLSAATGHIPALLVEAGLVSPGRETLPAWAFGLLAILLSLGLQLLFFGPVLRASRSEGREFVHTVALLLIAIALFQAINALPQLIWPRDELAGRTPAAALRLALVVPFLLLGLGWVEGRQQGGSRLDAWRRIGLRLWADPSAMWLALLAGSVVAWPWVVVGSLGSPGTTLGNVVQALPNALDEEILFRGFALAWLWRSVGRSRAALVSMLLFVAAQGGTALPMADLGAVPRFGAALALGLLFTELAVRAGGSVWPAVAAHFLYDWFHLAFVDPRTQEEVLHWAASGYAPLAAAGLGLVLWLGRKISQAGRERPPSQSSTRRTVFWAALSLLAWLGVGSLYLSAGMPGFHPDGFLIFLREQADLAPAAEIADPAERRAWVYRALVDTAQRSQAPLRAELDRLGVRYRPHYVANAIEVLARPGLRRRFSGWAEVERVLFQPGVRPYAYPTKIPAMLTGGPSGAEWNVREVGADQVWALGYTGQAVLVGGADTGFDWEHPALQEAYQGWAGGQVDHNYHWYDAWDGRTEPWDDNGHGTHTIGTVLGRHSRNQIGLAPGARWIGCRNMRQGLGNPGSYLACMEFLLAPFPLDGDPFVDGDPARGAAVVNNSWGCPDIEGCQPDTLQRAVESLRAAGQMMVVSAGNSGPACGTVQDPPATYSTVFSVGAIGQNDRIAGFSSRGPVEAGGDASVLKPDIVAPGINIRSAVPGGYARLPGTSMAGPHVTGAVALIWSAVPELVGDLESTESLLTETAQRLTPDAVCPQGPQGTATVCACGQGPDAVPNNVYGWGQVDVWAAFQQLRAGWQGFSLDN